MTASDVPAPATGAARAEPLVREVEREIRDGVVPPGQRLGTKEELRARFRVTIGVVDAAVRELERRGVVETRRGIGGGIFAAAARSNEEREEVVAEQPLLHAPPAAGTG